MQSNVSEFISLHCIQCRAEELGVTPPLGFWDPLGFSKFENAELAKLQFKRRRIVEIQHGRVAMLACIGYIVPEYFRWPGFCSPSMNLAFTDIPNGLKGAAMVPLAGWLQIITFASSSEDDEWRETKIRRVLNLQAVQEGDVLGDYGYGAFGIPYGKKIEDKEKKLKSLTAEINNGRLAMMAIIGMFYQDGLTGSAWGDWANYTDSPLRAFEEELGVQAPVGFWDPVGYTRDGDITTFKRRRETEIKHGRVAMYATMGYIVPEYFKWPGYLSPSMGLKFSDVPNGLAAITKVPGNGWAQIVAFAGYYELFVYKYNGTPGDYGWKVLSSADPDGKKRKLSAELANGRLAMTLGRSAWGDWANYTDSPLRAFENETGVQPPVGFWDPLGLSTSGNLSDYKRRREVELKHGRVAMFATIGYILPEYWRFPGYLSKFLDIKFSEVPNGLSAFSKVPSLGWLQIVGFAGIVELNVYNEQVNDEPGNYGAGFLGLRSVGFMNAGIADPEVRKKKLNAELANGRLAMFAIIGMFFQDGLTGSAWGDWANYTDSPLRAFEDTGTWNTQDELGVQAPVGFWDPVGYTRDGDIENFKRRRETEIKHGRVAMYATMGYIVPEYFKWPGHWQLLGYLSPSMGLKFEDVPNGLAAITKVPSGGWTQIVAFAGYYELFVYKYNGTPGDYGWKVLTSADPEAKKRKLSAELANGRLAMTLDLCALNAMQSHPEVELRMAIIGMFFQDGLTGSAWGDWANYTDSPLRAFENETGVQPPVGFWDPLGLSVSGNVSDYKRRREVELKHGRVAMFATIGYILPEYWRFPGYLSKFLDIKFSEVPNGLSAFSKVPAMGWLQIVGFAGIVELNVYNEQVNDEPGNYGAGFLGLRSIGFMNAGIADPEVRKKKLNAELANGRLAMFAIIGMFFQDGLTGSAWGDWANYADSPLRAFEGELGVQPPVGFWDPLGLSSDGDVEVFKRRREVELKHGRISMYACMGYIVPEYFRFPGDLSPKLGLSFESIPNGLAALTKVPGQGWAQIVAFLGTYELFINKPVGDEPGNYGKGNLGLGFLGPVKDPEILRLHCAFAMPRTSYPLPGGIGSFGEFWPYYCREHSLRANRWLHFCGSLTGLFLLFRTLFTGADKRRLPLCPLIGYGCAWIGHFFVEQNKPASFKYPLYSFTGDWVMVWMMLLGKMDAEARKKKLSAELANGRLAMMAIIGMFFQDGLTGSAWGDWANYTDSPLRAFEGELGVQAPVGFWDPLGLSADGDIDTFKRRRAVELKHGRICMLACIGYIVPEYFRWPGYLSPEKGIKFADMPHGIAAIGKVPLEGWVQIVLFLGHYEGYFWRQNPKRAPGDYEGYGFLGAGKNFIFNFEPILFQDPEVRKTKLAAELANGRLAMVALMAMLFQNGTVGTTGPAMWLPSA
eukprot:s114_g41.t3